MNRKQGSEQCVLELDPEPEIYELLSWDLCGERSHRKRSSRCQRSLLLLASAAALVFSAVAQTSVITSPTAVVHEPAPPTLPARWNTFTDPTFGTTILRLTGPEDGANCDISYGMWPVFNANDTYALAECGNTSYVYQLDPATLKVIERITLPASFLSADAIWSHSNPNVLFHRVGTGIAAYNVSTGTDVQLVDWSKTLADEPFSFRMTASEDDDLFCWAAETTTYQYVGWACWQRSTGHFWREPSARHGEYFKIWVDKSGRWVWNNSGVNPGEAFDLLNGGATTGTMSTLAPDWAPGHGVQGFGWAIGADAGEAADTRRNWSNVHTFTYTVPPTHDWSQTAEYSMLDTANDWYYVAYTELHAHTDGLFHDELVGRATNGSGRVKRLAHLHMIVGYDASGNYDYMTIAKSSVSYDERLVAFSSNWGVSGGRRDVFVVRIPQ